MHARPIRNILATVATAATLIVSTSAHAALTDGLVANWRLDETAGTFADASGNGKTATAVGDPYGTGSNGLIGGAADLDGSSDWVNGGDVGNFDVSDSFSAAFWLNLDATPTDFDFYVGRQKTAGGVQGWRVGNGNPDRDQVRVIFQEDDGSFFYVEETDNVLGSSGWIHLAFTYDGSGSNTGVKLYADGSMPTWVGFDVGGSVSDLTTPGIDLSLGARDADGGGKVAGDIDEVGIWDRALTANEIEELYNNGAGRRIVSPSTTTGSIPEPATLVMAGFAGLALLRRTRR